MAILISPFVCSLPDVFVTWPFMSTIVIVYVSVNTTVVGAATSNTSTVKEVRSTGTNSPLLSTARDTSKVPSRLSVRVIPSGGVPPIANLLLLAAIPLTAVAEVIFELVSSKVNAAVPVG